MTDSVPDKTILAFDSWTKGARHFVPLARELKKVGYQLLLVHLGSWGHDKERPAEERQDDLILRDISWYRNNGAQFEQILDREKPHAVLFLSTRAFAHQAMNRFALVRNIPTFHILHGLIYVQHVSLTKSTYKSNFWRRLTLLRERAVKNVCYIFPCYFRALIKTGAPLTHWLATFSEMFKKAMSSGGIIAPPDSMTIAGLVYTKADIPFLRDGYRLNPSNIHEIGNPDLTRFGLQEGDIGAFTPGTVEGDGSVLYLDTGLDVAGLVFPNEGTFFDHIRSLQTALAPELRLKIKLHPARRSQALVDQLDQAGVARVENDAFVNELKQVSAVISEPSTVAMLPAVMGRPLGLVQFGALSSQKYGPVLMSYPFGKLLRSPNEVRDIVAMKSAENQEVLTDWLDENVGPRPLDEVWERAIQVILSYLPQANSTDRGSVLESQSRKP